MKRLKGFTLVELVIVIAIVIILSVVSVPIYRGYTKNAKMAEGYALLGTIFSAQKAYFSQYGNFRIGFDGYLAYSCEDPNLGIDARSNKYFTAFNSNYISKSTDEVKYKFRARVIMPKELRTSNYNSLLVLEYTITSSAQFSESFT